MRHSPHDVRRNRRAAASLLLVVTAMCLSAVAHALPARLNDTGQTRCYAGIIEEVIEVIDCNSYDWPGQDGSHGRDAAHTTDVLDKIGDGDVAFDFTRISAAGADLSSGEPPAGDWACTRDNATGLLWQAQPLHGLAWSPARQAASDANTTLLCGHGDWRLPTLAELQGLVHYGKSGLPSLDADFLPGSIAGFHWSADADRTPGSRARVVNFQHGYVNAVAAASAASVRLVRGASWHGGFVDHGDGTVSEPRTGLMWDVCALGTHADTGCAGTDEITTWQDALWLVRERNNANWRGHNDWRMPNVKELASLIDATRQRPTIDHRHFPAAAGAAHWTATTHHTFPHMAWAVYFGAGNVFAKDKNTVARLRLVRSGIADPGSGRAPDALFADSFDHAGTMTLGTPPVVALTTANGAPVDRNDYVDGTITIAGNDPGSDFDFEGTLEIKGRGNSTWLMDKKPYRIKLTSKAPLLGMPSNRHWVLLANHADKSLLRTELAMSLGESLQMAWTPRFRQVEVTLNGEYLGSYQLGEHVRVGSDRVNIAGMKSGDIDPPALTGGYLMEIDGRLNCAPEVQVVTSRGTRVCIDDPDEDDIVAPQYDYISNYLEHTENAIWSANFANPLIGYAAWLDTESFVDWFLVNELTANVDSARHTSIKNFKDRNGKLFRGPLWDFDISAGNVYYCVCTDPEGFWVRNGLWYERLFLDPLFAMITRVRWDALKSVRLDDLDRYIDARARALGEVPQRNFDRWPIDAGWTWPNSVVTGSHEGETAFLKDWLQQRIDWLDAHL